MSKNYDKTLTRLIGILTKLAAGEQPTTKELAEEFGVGGFAPFKKISANV